VKVGEVWMKSSNEDAEKHVLKASKAAQKKLEQLEAESVTIAAELAELKKLLYGKFGNSINLETQEEDD
jgi:prefoldin subunit 4